MELDDIIEKCTNIIMWTSVNDSDILELIRYKRKFSKIQKATSADWNSTETDYNFNRADRYIYWSEQLREDGKKYTDGQCDKLSKRDAEREYWDYRSKVWEAYSIPNFIKTIDSFIMHYNIIKRENFNLNFVNTNEDT